MTTPDDLLRDDGWRLRNSAWLLVPLLSLGLLTFAAFLYVGARLGRRRLLVYGGLYLASTVAVLVLTALALDAAGSPLDDVATWLMLGVWVAGAVHAWDVNHGFLVWKAERATERAASADLPRRTGPDLFPS